MARKNRYSALRLLREGMREHKGLRPAWHPDLHQDRHGS